MGGGSANFKSARQACEDRRAAVGGHDHKRRIGAREIPMSSLAFMHPRAACFLLLAAAPAFATQLAGTVQDGAGQPVAGALVVGSTDTDQRLPNGLKRHWIVTSDAAGRFVLADFPAGACHVTANAGAAGLGKEREPCEASDGTTPRETTVVIHKESVPAGGHVQRPTHTATSSGDYVLVARVPAGEHGPLVIYGTRIEQDAWTMDLSAGAWMAKAITPTIESGSTQFALPARTKPINLNLAAPQGSSRALAHELQAMVAKDQAARDRLIAAGLQDKKSLAATRLVDRANLARIKQIVQQHGWPTAALIGNAGMGDLWLLVQHSPGSFIAQALPHLTAAADRGEIEWTAMALMIDRDLGDRGKPQIYGSQGRIEADGHFELSPVIDPANLDQRRAEVGLGPIADYKALIEKEYRKPASSN
jgi:hypothetical protein